MQNKSFFKAYLYGFLMLGSILAVTGLVAYLTVELNSVIPFVIFMFLAMTPIIALTGGWKPWDSEEEKDVTQTKRKTYRTGKRFKSRRKQ